jgi:SAM-dependent MidA family methyltransferase
MAADVLTELSLHDALPDHYLILETSADLKQRQRQLLQERVPGLCQRVSWLNEWPREPITGIILANEVLDAIPVHRIKISSGSVVELQVASAGQSFTWEPVAASGPLADQIRAVLAVVMPVLPDGYVTEFNLLLQGFIGSLSDVLHNGVILLVDYGYSRREYYHPQRLAGTLSCYYRHRRHDDPFLYVGLQDITASVDFTLLAESARSAGLDVAGFTTQSSFLIACGLDELIRQYSNGDGKKLLHYSQQAGQLILPGEMGENVKVMALVRGAQPPLMGFQFSDHTHRL